MIFFERMQSDLLLFPKAMVDAYRMDETECVQTLLRELNFSTEKQRKTNQLARQFVEMVRTKDEDRSGIEAFMMHYDLGSEEGVMLMCLAEALLRIPDKETEDLLIRDKMTSANWQKHIGRSESSFVNLATRGLAFSGKVLKLQENQGYFRNLWQSFIRKTGEPIVRQGVRQAIKILSEQFVLGKNITEAIKHSKTMIAKGYSYSYDMLGEVARTQHDADRYFQAYINAIEKIGASFNERNLFHGPSISVKLSALYPRYEFSQHEVAIPYLADRLKTLALLAKKCGISLTVDAEEADRLEMSLAILKIVFLDDELKEWSGLGLAVQAYQKRAFYVIQWLIELARRHHKSIPVRLVKGAYWDSEIKMTQIAGYQNYPVFTRKISTDVSYLACAQLMLSAQDAIYPQFATHNAYTVAAILNMMDDPTHYDFEFQNLQGMGKALHDQVIEKKIACRIYAPVGSHEDLLPYLVRRLLENGANSSFVHKISDKNTPVDKLIADPVEKVKQLKIIPNLGIPLPGNLYGNDRKNSEGLDFSHAAQLNALSQEITTILKQTEWFAAPFNETLQEAQSNNRKIENVLNPSDHGEVVGQYSEATEQDVERALERASNAFAAWDELGIEKRAAILEKAGDLLEKNRAELMALLVLEAGRTVGNTQSEVREATDFCRYYAMMARKHLSDQLLPGPTGESNSLGIRGRGVLVCISPWNFPVAIFSGQIAAALVTGNAVIAKPAEQTPLVAAKVIELFYEAGVPRDVLPLIPGRGETVGAQLVRDPRIAGVLFTGSTEVARLINRSLADRDGPIPLLIAETGGMNALIADSSALPEQLVFDAVQSAFDSAGQRCSALRILCIQEEIADKTIEMLKGAMAELSIGNPLYLSTDIGPVIDSDAKKMLENYQNKIPEYAKLIYRVSLPETTQKGTFFAPQAYEITDFKFLTKEIFGPVLHVIRFRQENLDSLIDSLNALGYGLTFGVQSRVNETIDHILKRIKTGNVYVNRNIIGAVVGVQPFGGSRLSGTGPKAGGPHYLGRLCQEVTVTVNTAAVGGNASLMAMED
jgi:RHH-type proline utilization regulon transcriptional repressor/proline dehydrogenase/delta 1-pyrroline-5-carboxylate dehydrogenase